MVDQNLGFKRSEIVDRVILYIGNESTEFETYVQNSIGLAEYRFCKLHDWGFLRKTGLELALTNAQDEYELNTSTIGYYMDAENVETIYDTSNGVVLKRVDLNQMRRINPEGDETAVASEGFSIWTPIERNKIKIWPKPELSAAFSLYVDGKISPIIQNDLNNYPTIPYKYQEGFIEYVIAMALDRENDERADIKRQTAVALINQDIKDDMRQLSNTENPRIRHMAEARYDGAATAIEAQLFGFLDRDY